MDTSLLLTLTSPDDMLVNVEVESVSFPGTEGAFTILSSHAPLIANLDSGDIVYVVGNESQRLSIKGGFVRVLNNKVEACIEV